ncbi:DUF2306 domain-containing protein [Winogradskyella poriferorum]|uniref:DUF2306 domain-containing protein n=1 Tax=Winogradskyella poriferorum TaxID=307627 RepID=UPI003D653940
MIEQSKSIRIGLGFVALIAILTSLYPGVFAFIPSSRGLFETKPDELLRSSWYIPIFMTHIGFGAIAILAGSTQFFDKIRIKKPSLHRNLGKIYVACVIPSGIMGLIVAFYATGKWYSKLGFILSALGWLTSTIVAFVQIRNRNIQLHRIWMMRSFAFCFAFVTFRIYLSLGEVLGLRFYNYYSYLSFLSWVPNLVFIERRIKKIKKAST